MRRDGTCIRFQANNTEGIRSELLARAPAVVVARAGHPAVKTGLSKDLYFELAHVALIWDRSAAANGVALELARMGLETRVLAFVPTVMALGAVAASSDLIATTSAFAGRVLAERYGLQIHPMPFSFPPLALYQLWHSRHDEDAAHSWLRGTIKALGRRSEQSLSK
ncbi:MAG: hypothetical protein HC869_14075 [Rhodospirillales bacterium]|nr:hypothetical protein [Rhodospirillales bacterium]